MSVVAYLSQVAVLSSPETTTYVTDVNDRVSLPAISGKIDSIHPFKSDNFNVTVTMKGNTVVIVHSLTKEQW